MRKMLSHQDLLYHALVMAGYDRLTLRDRELSIGEAVDNPDVFNSLSFIINTYSALAVHGSTFLLKFFKPHNYGGSVSDIEVHPVEDNDLFPALHNTIGAQLAYCLHVVSDVAVKLSARNDKVLNTDIFVEIFIEIAEVTPSGGYIEPQPIIASLMEQKILELSSKMDVGPAKAKPESTQDFIALSPLADDDKSEASLSSHLEVEVNEFIKPNDDSDLSVFG